MTELRSTAFDRKEIGEALFDNLRTLHHGQWVAVRVQDEAHWEAVRPRSQEAILSACETDRDKLTREIAWALEARSAAEPINRSVAPEPYFLAMAEAAFDALESRTKGDSSNEG